MYTLYVNSHTFPYNITVLNFIFSSKGSYVYRLIVYHYELHPFLIKMTMSYSRSLKKH